MSTDGRTGPEPVAALVVLPNAGIVPATLPAAVGKRGWPGPSALSRTGGRGETQSMAQRDLSPLTEPDCYSLAGGVHVGRLLFVDEVGPVAVPLNFSFAGRDVVFRSAAVREVALAQEVAGFEVDEISETEHSGWSVLFRGPVSEVPDDEVPALLRVMEGRFPTPWAVGVHNRWMRLTPRTVTGRRLGEPVTVPMV